MNLSFVVVGDAMLDITARLQGPIAWGSDSPADIRFQPGGSGANTARWLAHTGHHTAFIAAVGDDPAGELVRSVLHADGVGPGLQSVPGATTGACIVLVDADGERTMLPDAGANSRLDSAAVPDALLTGHLHVSGYTLLNPASREAGLAIVRRAHALGCTLSLDPASAAPLEAAPAAFDALDGIVDVLIANSDEARVLTGVADPVEACRILAQRYPTAVVKRGADGAVAQHGADGARIDAAPARVLDTTGAGDAFAAGFLPRWAEGAGLSEALGAGVGLAARAVGRVGAGPPPRLP